MPIKCLKIGSGVCYSVVVENICMADETRSVCFMIQSRSDSTQLFSDIIDTFPSQMCHFFLIFGARKFDHESFGIIFELDSKHDLSGRLKHRAG